ncbi:DUF1353 domain-containing protein [Rhizorhabdus wittichii]|uniref:DUF1353 domain-containing protein n=1 Tax=Rhizorhabdus wittichii TaxID=160791 RepID=A0A975HFK9_9SPHN|nr:DUF1353 domain-containing protein [Rhizorhabdus wittichii]QTH22019.1 DUF1353 domain-containing protein [Rhizorhabdus wittichii]
MTPRFLASPPTPAVGKRPNGKTEYRASGPIIFSDARGVIHTVPTGWRSDGISWPVWLLAAIALAGAAAVGAQLFGAPWWAVVALGGWAALWGAFWLLRPRQRLMVAAFVHDWACQQVFLFPDKADADRLFAEAMKALRVAAIYRVPLYAWVRLRRQRVQWQQPELAPVMDGGRVVGWR